MRVREGRCAGEFWASTYRHGIDSRRWYVVDDDAARVDMLERVPSVVDIARKHSGLEAVLGVVHLLDGLLERRDLGDGAHGSKDLGAHDGRAAMSVLQESYVYDAVRSARAPCTVQRATIHPHAHRLSRTMERTRSLATDQDLCSVRVDRFAHHTLDADGFRLGNHGAKEGRCFERMTATLVEFLGTFDQLGPDLVVHLLVNEDTL